MLHPEFIECTADFFGDVSLDEIAERLGVTTAELLEYLEDLLDENYDNLSEEMGYNEESNEEED